MDSSPIARAVALLAGIDPRAQAQLPLCDRSLQRGVDFRVLRVAGDSTPVLEEAEQAISAGPTRTPCRPAGTASWPMHWVRLGVTCS